MDTKLIGNKIANARKEKNISQAQIAELLFISPQAVGKWERGESIPDIITVNRLAKIFEVDLNYFSDGLQPTVAEALPDQGLKTTATELPLGKQQKKFSWNMSRGKWVDADFSGLKNLDDKFNSSHMLRCKFIGSDLSGLLLKSNHVENCDFSGSNINNSHIQSSHLTGNIFTNCALNETEFLECDIKNCDFAGANFTGVLIKNSAFQKIPVADAVWKQTRFSATHIADIVFNSTIDDCYFENCAFSKIIFQNVTLTNTFFKCKNLKGIQFIDCFADRMTYEFLKNGKADVGGIVLLTT